MWSVSPRFSWHTRITGKVPPADGRAKYPATCVSSPANSTASARTSGSSGATVPGGEEGAAAEAEAVAADSADPPGGGETGASVALGEDGLQAAREGSGRKRRPGAQGGRLVAAPP